MTSGYRFVGHCLYYFDISTTVIRYGFISVDIFFDIHILYSLAKKSVLHRLYLDSRHKSLVYDFNYIMTTYYSHYFCKLIYTNSYFFFYT